LEGQEDLRIHICG